LPPAVAARDDCFDEERQTLRRQQGRVGCPGSGGATRVVRLRRKITGWSGSPELAAALVLLVCRVDGRADSHEVPCFKGRLPLGYSGVEAPRVERNRTIKRESRVGHSVRPLAFNEWRVV